MKYKFLILIVAVILLSCSKEGEVLGRSTNHININGVEYYFIKVVPADGERGVWLLVPKDSKVEMPQIISYNYTTSCGKNCFRTRSVESIFIKS